MDKAQIKEFIGRYRLFLMAGCMGFLLMTSIGFGAIYGSNKLCKDSEGIKVVNEAGVKICVIKANVQRDYCISLNEGLNQPTIYYNPEVALT
jgi:hypothetical protein